MLRSRGIGARVIVGFKTDPINAADQATVVRQSNAHSWVEVYLPPENLTARQNQPGNDWWTYGGWLRLDPTPASTEPQSLMTSFSFRYSDFKQWVTNIWGEFFLNMNPSKQAEWIYTPIKQGVHYLATHVFQVAFWREMIVNVFLHSKAMVVHASKTSSGLGTWFVFILPIAFVLVLVLLLQRVWRWVRSCWQRHSTQDRRRQATIEFYVRMETLLTHLKRARHRGETPLEYVGQTDFMEMTRPIVDAYYRVRYGNAILTHTEIVHVQELLGALELLLAESLSTRS
jgi:hypothetical protein